MSAEDRVRWDKVYRERQNETFPSPDPLLLQYTPSIDANTQAVALDFAGGVGQNGLWLGTQGYETDIMDISRVALQRARVEMTIRNLRNVNLLQIDVDSYPFEEGKSYDLVCVFRYLKRDLFDKIKAVTKPNGRVIYESYNTRYLEKVPGFNPDFLFEIGELDNFFQDWQVIYTEEVDHNSRLVAVKPEASKFSF